MSNDALMHHGCLKGYSNQVSFKCLIIEHVVNDYMSYRVVVYAWISLENHNGNSGLLSRSINETYIAPISLADRAQRRTNPQRDHVS